MDIFLLVLALVIFLVLLVLAYRKDMKNGSVKWYEFFLVPFLLLTIIGHSKIPEPINNLITALWLIMATGAMIRWIVKRRREKK